MKAFVSHKPPTPPRKKAATGRPGQSGIYARIYTALAACLLGLAACGGGGDDAQPCRTERITGPISGIEPNVATISLEGGLDGSGWNVTASFTLAATQGTTRIISLTTDAGDSHAVVSFHPEADVSQIGSVQWHFAPGNSRAVTLATWGLSNSSISGVTISACPDR